MEYLFGTNPRRGHHDHDQQQTQEQTQGQKLSKEVRLRQVFLRSVSHSLNIVDNFLNAFRSGDETNARATNLLATSSLNLIQASAQKVKKRRDEDGLVMAREMVRQRRRLTMEENSDLLGDSEDAYTAFENFYGYLEQAVSGEKMPILPACSEVSENPQDWNGIFGQILLGQHRTEQFERDMEEEPSKVMEEQAKLLENASMNPNFEPEQCQYDVEKMATLYEHGPDEDPREVKLEVQRIMKEGQENEEKEEETTRRALESMVMSADISPVDQAAMMKDTTDVVMDGFDWIRSLPTGSEVVFADKNGKLFSGRKKEVVEEDQMLRVLYEGNGRLVQIEVPFVNCVNPDEVPQF